jgi:hypothetical protein
LLVEKQQIEVVNTEYEPQTAAEVLARILDRLGEKAARALADAFGLEYDEAAIRALINGSNGSQAPARAIEWRPPRPDRKRELAPLYGRSFNSSIRRLRRFELLSR